jgi:hypothetical protein
MDETPQKKKLDLDSELGVSRRDLLRRGAIVAGTLAWTAPAIQSMAPKALAARQGPSPGQCAACYCWEGDKQSPTPINGGPGDWGTINGVVVAGGLFSSDDCENWCKHQAQYAGSGAPFGPYSDYEYCSGTSCNINTSTTGGTNGATCS